MAHSSKKASAFEQSPSKITSSLPLSFVPLLRSSGFLAAAPGGPPLPPPPPPPPPLLLGAFYRNPEPPNHLSSGVSSRGPPPLRTEDVPSSVAKACVGSVVVCVAMMVVIESSLEVAVWLLGLERVGMYSANFSSCLLLFSSS